MKFEPRRLADYTDEALLAEIRRVAAIVSGSTLSTAAFTEHARVGLTTLRRRFGGWREALEAAGLGHLYQEVPPARVSRSRARGWTTDQVIEELRRVAAVVGRQSLTVDDFRKHATIGPDAVRARFGGWPQALRAAGLEPVNHGRRYSDEECFENLLAVWTHYGRPPKYQEMNTTPSTVGGKAYMKRWGTWNRAVHAFTDYVESEAATPSTEHPSQGPKERLPIPASIPKAEDRREPSIGLRYRVLRRDRFRCVTCGRSPAMDPGCKLHVDHVVPFSKGGKTTLENLRALCAECNLGKGGLLEPDA
jgi:hypothetical protein